MENNFAHSDASVVNSEGSAKSEALDVKRDARACSDLLGPVVVSGDPCADRFSWVGEKQAGAEKGDQFTVFPSTPDLRPW